MVTGNAAATSLVKRMKGGALSEIPAMCRRAATASYIATAAQATKPATQATVMLGNIPPSEASGSATAVPMAASSSASVSNWRVSRSRLAPSARRRLNSFWRPAERASRRLATFAPAISSTTPHIARRMPSGLAKMNLTLFCASNSGLKSRPMVMFELGWCLARIPPKRRTSARACWSETPGFSRATVSRPRAPRSCKISWLTWFRREPRVSGTHMSKARPRQAPPNCGGMTPMIVI